MVVHRLSSMNFIREEGRVPQVRGFFSCYKKALSHEDSAFFSSQRLAVSR